jgi:hypothetical protein
MWNFEISISKQLGSLKQKYPQCEIIEISSDKDLKNLEALFSIKDI